MAEGVVAPWISACQRPIPSSLPVDVWSELTDVVRVPQLGLGVVADIDILKAMPRRTTTTPPAT